MASIKFYTRYIFIKEGTKPFLQGTFKYQKQLEERAAFDKCTVMDEVMYLIGFGNCFGDYEKAGLTNLFARFIDSCLANSLPIIKEEYEYWQNAGVREFTKDMDVKPIALQSESNDVELTTTYVYKLYLAANYFYKTVNLKSSMANISKDDVSVSALADKGELGKALNKAVKTGKWGRYLNKYLKDNFNIFYTDDSVAAVEADVMTSAKGTIYLPSTRFSGLSNADTLNTFKDLVLELYRGISFTNCMSINLRNSLTYLGDIHGNALMYTEETGANLFMSLEILRRRCQANSINVILKDIFQIGDVEFIQDDVLLVGSCSEKIFILTSFSYILTDVKYINTVLNKIDELSNIMDLNTPDIWKMVVGNRSPIDGRYNHIVENNIQ